MTAFTPRRAVPLAAQSRLEPVPYSLPASSTSGVPLGDVLHRGVVDRHHFAAAGKCRSSCLPCRDQRVLDADVPERAPHHDLVITPARAEGVPVHLRDPVLPQVAGGRAVLRDGSPPARCGRWSPSRPGRPAPGRPLMSRERRRARRQVLEERRLLDVGGVRVPGIAAALRHRQRLPRLVALEHLAVAAA